MRGMKITVDAAMRARDVSRPRPEDEALAQEAEAAEAAEEAEEAGPKPAGSTERTAGNAPRPGQGRRRRRRR
jgi:hypothetical protein